MMVTVCIILGVLLLCSCLVVILLLHKNRVEHKTETYTITIDDFDFDIRLTKAGANGVVDVIDQYEYMRGKGTIKITGKF